MNYEIFLSKRWLSIFIPVLVLGILMILAIVFISASFQYLIIKSILYIFFILSLFALLKPWKYLNTSVDEEALINKYGIVTKKCSPFGYVKISNEIWKAKSSTGESIVQGDEIVVCGIEGSCLIIKKSTGHSPA
jgi:membrane protein implicated in regulation of membrane protease activity